MCLNATMIHFGYIESKDPLNASLNSQHGAQQGPTNFFAAYKQISLIGSVPTKFTINSTTNWGLCLQAALAC